MESFSGDTEEGTDNILGRKKPKHKSLKSRLFGRTKREDTEETNKLSQSASDITAGKELGSDEDLLCSQGMMGSRALSHDSIFLAEDLTDPEPARVLSQENVHSKIKALQMKLQLQKMHLGPPPMVLPVRSPAELGSRSEDNLHQSSQDASGEVRTSQETLTKTTSQPGSCSLSPIFRSAQTKSLPPTPSHPLSLSVPPISTTSTAEAPLDFSTPAHLSARLDMSAARHRMSIKPRNQRASTRKKHSTVAHSGPLLPTLNSIGLLESVEDQVTQEEEVEKADKGRVITPSQLLLKSSEVSPLTSDAAPKPPSQSVLQQDPVLPLTAASQLLRPKPHMRADAVTRERPHSSFIESEMKERREVDCGKHTIMFHDKKNAANKVVKTETPSDQLSNTISASAASRSSSAQQGLEGEGTKGIKRPAPGSGSFKFSISAIKHRDEERPRSISFAGVPDQTEARQKAVGGPVEKSLKEKEDVLSSQHRGSPFPLGRLMQEGAPPKSSVHTPQDRKAEVVTPSKNAHTDARAVEAVEIESSQELVEEAEEAKEVQEEEGKTAFGIKLRATSQSLKYRSETNRHSRTLQDEDQGEKLRRQEMSDNVHRMPNTSSASKATDSAPSGISLPAKHNTSPTDNTEVQKVFSNLKETQAAPQEPQPAPQTPSSEVSWMSLAMEKTRSLQQLFSGRFSRDLTSVQTSARAQAQAQQTSQTEVATGAQTQAAAVHPPGDAVKEESPQSRSQEQTVKPSTIAAQQKMTVTSPVQSNTPREPQTAKQTKEDQSQVSTTQPVSHPVPQTNPWTAQSPLRSSSRTSTTSPSPHGNSAPSLAQYYISSGQQQQQQQQQQPSWSNRSFQTAAQLKPTTSALSTVSAASAPDSAPERGERDASVQKEGPALSTTRTLWTGSMGDRAAFLEKRAEWTASPLLKGVELRKSQTEMQTSGDPPSPAKPIPVSRETSEGRQAVKAAESSPTKAPEKLREDRWLRKNVGSPSSPSSSPTHPSVLQSMSESGQPSWMELAKRKSMAWSDKTMD